MSFVKKYGRWIALILVGAMATYGVRYYYTNKTETVVTKAVYKESKITRGNLTVGVSETCTATIGYQTVRSPVDTKVDVAAVYVKAGQSVAVGQKLISLDVSDLKDSLSDLQYDYDTAKISYSQALLDQKTGLMNAKYTLAQNQQKGEAAEDTYDMSVEDLKNSMEESYYDIDDIEEDITYYSQKLLNLDSAYDLDGLETAKNEAETALGVAQKAYDATPTADLLVALNAAKTAASEAKIAYAAEYKDYQDDLKTYSDKVTSLEDSYETAESKFEASKLSYTLSTLEAKQTKDETLFSSENAQAIYDITVMTLDQTVSSKNIALQKLELEIADLKTQIAAGVVTAPYSGLIEAISVSEGGSLAVDGTILTIADMTKVYMSVTISQEDITSLSIGQKADITFDSYEKKTYEGVVDSISVTPLRAGASTVNYSITVMVKNPPAIVYEGMSGNATFITRQQENVLIVSNRAVVTDSGKQYLLIKGADGQPVKTEVTTGFSDGVNAEVITGVSEGDIALIESKVSK